MGAAPVIRARITEVTYEVEGSDDPLPITVTWRGGETYAVARRGRVWNGSEWEWEPQPSSRDDDFIARTRFGYDEAQAMALRLTREALGPDNAESRPTSPGEGEAGRQQ